MADQRAITWRCPRCDYRHIDDHECAPGHVRCCVCKVAISTHHARFAPGQRVVYVDGSGRGEEGTVTSVNERWVFVCYGPPGSTSKATNPAALEVIA